jgi:NAD+ kinase
VANPTKPAVGGVLKHAAELLRGGAVDVLADERTAALMNGEVKEKAETVRSLARGVDLVLVFGGDGTMLRVVRELEGAKTPVLGINVGRLGFLTAVSSRELESAMKKVLAGEFVVERRPLLLAEGVASGRPVALYGLNDAVIGRGTAPRMVELEVTVDGAQVTKYRCDGLIISSPTGSTAYSLSAGGAIISPSARVFALTPICPHTLSNRALIFDANSRIEVRVLSARVDTVLTVDGQVNAALNTGDTICVRRGRREAWLARLAGTTFFETVRRKLNWSGMNV